MATDLWLGLQAAAGWLLLVPPRTLLLAPLLPLLLLLLPLPLLLLRALPSATVAPRSGRRSGWGMKPLPAGWRWLGP